MPSYADLARMRELTERLWKIEHGLGDGAETIDASYVEERVQTFLIAGVNISELETALADARSE
jgi:hypothetical protein